MKLHRFAAALVAALLSVAPLRAAEQSSIVTPTAGPMTMATYAAAVNAALRALGSCHWGAAAPANGPGASPLTYQCWWDTSGNPRVLKIYDGAQWVTFGKLDTTSHAWTPSYQGAYLGNASVGTIGSTVQAWDADLDALAALSGTNTIYYRSGAAAWSPVTIGGLLTFSGGALNVGDAELVAIAGLASAADKCHYFTGSGTAALTDCPAFGRSVLAAASASALRTLAGVVIGTDIQAFDAELAAIAGLTAAANKCFYFTGVGAAATYDCSSFGRSVANVSDAAALRALAGVAIGADVQAFDAELAAIAGLTSATNKCFYFTGIGTAATFDCSSFGRSVASLADAAALRTLAGSVIGADVQAYDGDLAALAANPTAGLWASTGAGTGAARTLIEPAAGLTISNPAGTAGNPTFALANDLAAVEGLACTGLVVRSATDTWLCRTIGGTANEISVANGDGVAGAPTFSLPSALTFTGKTVTGGTYSGAAFAGISDLQGTLKVSGFVTSTSLAANANDYTGTDGSNTCSTKTVLRVSGTAARNITGLSCGQAEGDVRIVHNVGAYNIVLTNQDVSSVVAANRFLFGGDLTLAPEASIALRYDGVASRWRAVVSPGTGGGGGGGGVTSFTVAAGVGVSVSGTCTVTTSGTCTVSIEADQLRQSLVDSMHVARLGSIANFSGMSFADSFGATTYLNTGGATNADTGTAGLVKNTMGGGTTVTINNQSGTSAGAANCVIVDRTTALTAGDVITKIGVYNNQASRNYSVKIVKRNSAGNYDVVVSQTLAHTASGWEDQTLSSSYTVPGSGTYYLAAWYASGTTNTSASGIARSYSACSGDVGVSTGNSGWTEDSVGSVYPLRMVKNATTAQNMTIETTSIAVPTTPTKAFVVARIKHVDASTAGTDYNLYVSRDGGTSYSSALTLTDVFTDPTDSAHVVQSAVTDISGITSGSNVRVKIVTGNNKSLELRDWAFRVAP